MKKLVVLLGLFMLALMWLTSAGPSLADDVNCGRDLLTLKPDAEQELFYRQQDGTWAAVPEGGLALTSRRVSLLYVIREFHLEQPRLGAIVVKTGREIAAGDFDPQPIDKQIRLRRLRQSAFEACTDAPFFRGKVSAHEYDLFHDYGYDASNTEDGGRLTKFHTKYIGRSGRCDSSTASTTFDAPARLDWRSNRSQFSFSSKVVRSGFESQIWAGLSFSQAKGVGSIGLADQRVEVLKYQTNDQKIACIPMKLALTGSRFFVRINDLEGRGAASRWIRAGELARQLTR